jgi:hypothetical protein
LHTLSRLAAAGYKTHDRGARTDASLLGGGALFLLGPKSSIIARPSQMPAILGESLFLTNPADASGSQVGQQVELRERRGGTERDADGPGSPAKHGGRPIVQILQSGHRLAAGEWRVAVQPRQYRHLRPRVHAVSPPPSTQAGMCGATANPWGYTFCGGSVILSPAGNFCSVFACIPSFWNQTNGYVVQCRDRLFSHSGGVRGSCSSHGGNGSILYMTTLAASKNAVAGPASKSREQPDSVLYGRRPALG